MRRAWYQIQHIASNFQNRGFRARRPRIWTMASEGDVAEPHGGYGRALWENAEGMGYKLRCVVAVSRVVLTQSCPRHMVDPFGRRRAAKWLALLRTKAR